MPLRGRQILAVAFIAFGLQQFFVGDIVPGRPPAWPPSLPGQLIGVYASGACFILAGLAMVVDRRTRQAALLVAALVFAWAVLRNTPVAIANTNFGSPWTRLGKAIALSGGALAVAGSTPGNVRVNSAFLLAGRLALGSYLIASGIQHFLFPAAVKTLIPMWIPGPVFWTYFAGVALIAGGVGVIVPATRQVAGLAVGLMLLTWFLILHIPRALLALPANQRNEWTAVFEALAFAGIAFALTQNSRGVTERDRSTDTP
jgi:uncharacterized membrane protein